MPPLPKFREQNSEFNSLAKNGGFAAIFARSGSPQPKPSCQNRTKYVNNFTVYINTKSMTLNMPLNQSLSLLMLGVTHANGVGPRTQPRCLEGVRKKFQMINLTIPNNFPLLKCDENSVLDLTNFGVSHGDGPRTLPRCR